MAHTAGVELSWMILSVFGKIFHNQVRPSGKYLMSELIAIGGIQPLMKRMLDAGMLDGSCLTVTGKTLAENLAEVEDYPEGQQIISFSTRQLKKTLTWWCSKVTCLQQVLWLNLPAKKVSVFRRACARVFEGEVGDAWHFRW